MLAFSLNDKYIKMNHPKYILSSKSVPVQYAMSINTIAISYYFEIDHNH